MDLPINVKRQASCHLCEAGVVAAIERDDESPVPQVFVFRCNRHDVIGRAGRYPIWSAKHEERLVPVKRAFNRRMSGA